VSVPVSEVETVLDVPDTGALAAAPIEGRSPASLAWRRIRRDRVTVASLCVVVLLLLLAVAAPFLKAFHVIDPSTPHPELVQGVGSVPTGPFSGASAEHWLGVVPGVGQDVLSRVLYGLTFDLSIALAATVLTVLIGTTVGVVAGYSRNWVDSALSRMMDLVLAFPQLIMLIALSPIFLGQPPQNARVVLYLIIVLAVFGWPYLARIVRSEMLSVRNLDYVMAARSLGAGTVRILWKELLPNLRGPILVYATIILPVFISSQAALAYLGISLQPPFPTLGSVLNDAVPYVTSDTAYFLVPGVVLVLVVLSFNLLGDGLADALNPRSDRM
jgi:peptide/nickel transport system permease protein